MTAALPDDGLQLTDEQAATLATLKKIRDQAGGAWHDAPRATHAAALRCQPQRCMAAAAPHMASCGCDVH